MTGILEHDRAGSLLDVLKKNTGIRRGIMASVLPEDRELTEKLESMLDIFILPGPDTPLPFKILYRSRDTLGPDRIAAMAGAHNKFPRSNVLVIDMGSAITYDLLSSEGKHQGGNISPGMSMRFRALNQFTGRLPLVEPTDKTGMLGLDTNEAIAAGVQQGILHEIEGYIDWGRMQFAELKVVVTGGDAGFFAKKLKSPIFVDQNLVLTGLDRILRYNAELAQK